MNNNIEALLQGSPDPLGFLPALLLSANVKTPTLRAGPRTGRNDLCPCGSEKKYKKCCGRRKK